jgi:putative FmdB family regulatory protein
MPIYAYRCGACGHTQDVLQKLSDPALVTCPACGADAYAKQVTAAGFQLKGSGWYVTDFRGGNSNGAAAAKGSESKPAGEGGAAAAPAAADASAATQKSAAPAADSGPSKPSESA